MYVHTVCRYVCTCVPYQYYVAGYKEPKYDDIADVGMKGSKQPGHSDYSKPDEQVDDIYGMRGRGKGGDYEEAVNQRARQALL